jgi:hypothetical protein
MPNKLSLARLMPQELERFAWLQVLRMSRQFSKNMAQAAGVAVAALK